MINRVLFLTPGLGKGGAETQLVKLARFLKRKNIDVSIISLKQINDFSLDLEAEGINIIFLKSSWLYSFVPNLYLLINAFRKYKPDVVISFMFIAIIFGRLLKKWFNFKLISSIRISQIDKKWDYMFKLTSGMDDAVVYNSNASKINFESGGFAMKKGVVIRNAVTIPDIEILPDLKNEPFKWICIAHFRDTKDYPTLFKAISILKDYHFNINIIGHLHNLVWPAQTILELGIENHVALLDFQANSAGFLKNSDALVLSSFSEGMPNAILEAMAYAKPVVASDIDGVNELISKSKGGILFEPGNSEELAAKMLEVMEMSVDSRKAIGLAGRQFIENNFEEKFILDEWLKLINPYLKQNSSLYK